jgi:hypothetical protein
MLNYQVFEAIEFMVSEAAVLGKSNRLKPELGDLAVALDVNMRRLGAVRAEERERIWSVAKNRRHWSSRQFAARKVVYELSHDG